MLVEGTAEVKKGTRRVNMLGPGDFFGEISLVRQVTADGDRGRTSPVRALVITDRQLPRRCSSTSRGSRPRC